MVARTKILVVDDDHVTLDALRIRLSSAGYDVVTREDSIGTSRAILQERPDLVLLDVNMPGLRGDLLADFIRRWPDMPKNSVILHSACEVTLLETLAARTGALGYIKKSGDRNTFLAQIEALLRKKQELAASNPSNEK